MKAYVVALVTALAISGPALAAPKCAADHKLAAALLTIKDRAPDVQAEAITDPSVVARGTAFINARPPVTHYAANQIEIVNSNEHQYGYAMLVDHGCITGVMGMPSVALAGFVQAIMGQAAAPTPQAEPVPTPNNEEIHL